MPVFALLIISRAGSLIYHKTFTSTTPNQPGSTATTGSLGLPGTTTLTTNDYLVLAGTFHGVHAITKTLTPKLAIPSPTSTTTQPLASSSGNTYHDEYTNGGISSTPTRTRKAPAYTLPNPDLPATGLESLESSFFKITVFQTLTGTKFLLFTDPSMPNCDILVRGVYERFADHVCKNPFWVMDNPVRIEGWERAVMAFLFRR